MGSRYAREDKKEGDIRVQKVLVPVNKESLFQFPCRRVFHTRQRRAKRLFRSRLRTSGSKGQRGGATDGGTGSTEGSSGVHVSLQNSQ